MAEKELVRKVSFTISSKVKYLEKLHSGCERFLQWNLQDTEEINGRRHPGMEKSSC